MDTMQPVRGIGWRVYGLSLAAMAVVGLAIHDFVPGQPAPKWLPDRAVFAYAVNGFILIAGAAMAWRRTAAWASAALLAYWGVVVVLLMDGRMIARNADRLLAYTNTSEQLALAAALAIVWATVWAAQGRLAPRTVARWVRGGQIAFGACAVLFGVAHFAFMEFTAPMVPKWLPPNQTFWGYATGVFHIAAGLAILSGVQARLAAILLTVMFAAFTPLVHLPIVLSDLSKPYPWCEMATNLVLTGAAWVVADSLRTKKA